MGLHENEERGAGCLFGPDITERFLELNNLEFIVRSHECVDDGYLMAHSGRLVTLFSASNYCGICDNLGAFLIFTSDLVPRFVQYTAEPLHQVPACFSYKQTLLEDEWAWQIPYLINRHYLALIDFWSGGDTHANTKGKSQDRSSRSLTQLSRSRGVISRKFWARGLRTVLGLRIDFLRFQKLLGLPVLGVTGTMDGPINFFSFLSQYRTIPSQQHRKRHEGMISVAPIFESDHEQSDTAGVGVDWSRKEAVEEFNFDTTDSGIPLLLVPFSLSPSPPFAAACPPAFDTIPSSQLICSCFPV